MTTTTWAVRPHTRHYGPKTSVYEKHPELRKPCPRCGECVQKKVSGRKVSV